ncbi:DUF5107 domain-containing protein [Arenibacter aquaticus]|uniref:DUF5107 domain-containing protein n=1 Tax=Arenibacter aquaticus TaxID=2489054 RepID=A0A3S0CIN1_9FLAO|nr:DUF5107 domain-containing protein [Arenibacter aquaticus]RTE52223.1 DUF5107 domain-containing protein [Arenibacter aquaticus]
MKLRSISLVMALGLYLGTMAQVPSLTIKEEVMSLKTYNFNKPNPVPILTDNAKIFPYFKFEEYEHVAKKKNWKVVTLENDYIKVFVLPEIGGKVWGAIEKSTGEEFLYKNEVVKFRNIAMRGPWTSGGIEFNFGLIGHHPSTATPVDYKVISNADGSVSCVVGNMDLPSRTVWRVEIKLEEDKAYFETNASWYNASPLNQSYYNWMTAAAVVSDDLEFIYPGNQFLEHGGDAKPWPIDSEGRDLSLYKNNNFGGDVSEHVVGDFKDFFGGYYHNKEFGFGHWAPYDEMPGQKLWLWSQARSGGIWEDLLTDHDGQYMEFQAGRLFNQYFPGDTNPISQANFEPYVMDRWREIWFPFKEIGGMVDANENGVLNVKESDNGLYIGINALQNLKDTLQVEINGKEIFTEALDLAPMELFSKLLPKQPKGEIVVKVGNSKLHYTNNNKGSLLKRPFKDDENIVVSENAKLYHEGWEALKFRDYALASEKLKQLLDREPAHQGALLKLAELEYRSTNYSTALIYVNKVLKQDTYLPEANYLAGIIYRSQKDYINALESFGWAARSMQFRSVSFAQMAEVYLLQNNFKKAELYTQKALDYNLYNINAKQIQLLLARKMSDKSEFDRAYNALLTADPLNHFALIESQLINNDLPLSVPNTIKNEFPNETILELAIYYQGLGLTKEALEVLELATNDVKADLWKSYLLRESNSTRSQQLLTQVLKSPIDFVYPYRAETTAVLEWAHSRDQDWKLTYYLAQNYIAIGQYDSGLQLLQDCGMEPDSHIFYRFRAKMLNDNNYPKKENDYLKALQYKADDWKIWEETIQFYLDHDHTDKAYKMAGKAYRTFSPNANIGLIYTKAALLVDEYKKTIEVLNNIQILPFEHASESKHIFTQAHILLALKNIEHKRYAKAITLLETSKQWPENLGVGKPHTVDERMQDYLLAHCYELLNDPDKKKELLGNIISRLQKGNTYGSNDLYRLLSLKKMGRETDLVQLQEKLSTAAAKGNEEAEWVLSLFKKDYNIPLKTKSGLKRSVWKILQASSKL